MAVGQERMKEEVLRVRENEGEEVQRRMTPLRENWERMGSELWERGGKGVIKRERKRDAKGICNERRMNGNESNHSAGKEYIS